MTTTNNAAVDVSMQSRWQDAKGREWRIVEKLPFGRNVCTTTDRRYQGEWTHKEIRAALRRFATGGDRDGR